MLSLGRVPTHPYREQKRGTQKNTRFKSAYSYLCLFVYPPPGCLEITIKTILTRLFAHQRHRVQGILRLITTLYRKLVAVLCYERAIYCCLLLLLWCAPVWCVCMAMSHLFTTLPPMHVRALPQIQRKILSHAQKRQKTAH